MAKEVGFNPMAVAAEKLETLLSVDDGKVTSHVVPLPAVCRSATVHMVDLQDTEIINPTFSTLPAKFLHGAEAKDRRRFSAPLVADLAVTSPCDVSVGLLIVLPLLGDPGSLLGCQRRVLGPLALPVSSTDAVDTLTHAAVFVAGVLVELREGFFHAALRALPYNTNCHEPIVSGGTYDMNALLWSMTRKALD